MKKLSLSFSLAFIVSILAYAGPNPVVKETTSGEMLKVHVVVNGETGLFKHDFETSTYNTEDPTTGYVHQKSIYYVEVSGSDKIQKLTRFNYKRVLKQHLTGDPDLTNKIGSKGYRYDDLEKILRTYNE